jgi:hypothetical protein
MWATGAAVFPAGGQPQAMASATGQDMSVEQMRTDILDALKSAFGSFYCQVEMQRELCLMKANMFDLAYSVMDVPKMTDRAWSRVGVEGKLLAHVRTALAKALQTDPRSGSARKLTPRGCGSWGPQPDLLSGVLQAGGCPASASSWGSTPVPQSAEHNDSKRVRLAETALGSGGWEAAVVWSVVVWSVVL